MCDPNAGYEGDGRTCTQASICATNNGGCSPLATCSSSSGKNENKRFCFHCQKEKTASATCSVRQHDHVFFFFFSSTSFKLPYMYLPSWLRGQWFWADGLHPDQQHMSDQQPLCPRTVCGECVCLFRHCGILWRPQGTNI